jgi:hypothetical protein
MYLLLFKPMIEINNQPYNISRNYVIEFEKILESGLDENILNNFNSNFYDFIKSHNYQVSLCSIVDAGNDFIYVSNFLGEEFNGVNNKQTIRVRKSSNPDYLYLNNNCVLDYNSPNKNIYFLSLTDNSTRTIFNNFESSLGEKILIID